MLLLADRGGVLILVLTQTVHQDVGGEVSKELVASLPDVLEAGQYLLELQRRKHLADVVYCVLKVRLRLEGTRGVEVARQALQLC